VAHGTTNPFGLDFDEHGEMFITNCVIDHLFHFVPGGHYERMYGQDANPHTYGLMKSCVDYRHWGSGAWTDSRANKDGTLKKEHSDAGGGHAHSGAAIYLGDNFPKEYRNTLFTANIHGNRLNNDGLERTKSGMKGVRRPDFLFANDPWFRGICVKVGPEGALYASDWCDTGECHNYDKADITNGRIYRVVYQTAKPFKGDVSKMTDEELVKLQLSPNEWLVRKARRVLQERAVSREPKASAAVADTLRALLKAEKEPARKLRVLWALHATDSIKGEELLPLFDEGEEVRAWAIRVAVALGKKPTSEVKNRAQDIIEKEQSPFVRAAIASAIMQDGTKPDADPDNVTYFTRNPNPIEDPQLELLTWYAFEAALRHNPKNVGLYFNDVKSSQIRRNIVRHAFSRPDPKDVEYQMLAFVQRIEIRASNNTPKDDQMLLDILHGMRDALQGRKTLPEPVGWHAVKAATAKKSPAIVREVETLSVLFGDKDAIAALVKRVSDTTAKAEDRRAAIELLGPRKLPDFAKTLQALLGDTELRGTAIRALAGYPDTTTPTAILKAYPTFTAQEKLDAVQTLASRVSFAKELLDAIEKGTLPRADVPLVTARQILALNDKTTTERLEKVWGKIGVASKERAALVKKWKGELTDDVIKQADVANGRALFTKHCSACHKMFGEGQAVGPELTGSQRSNLDYVLENVIDPSAVVPREYQMVNFSLNDERVISGIVLRETKDAITVRTTNDTLTIPVADIVTRKQTPVSIMPEGIFEQLKPNEVRDLVAYLRVKEQVPLPKK
jgi:putative heme-binding domain-containing protein